MNELTVFEKFKEESRINRRKRKGLGNGSPNPKSLYRHLVAGEGFSHNFTFPTIRIPLISDKKKKSLQSKQSPPKKVR